MRCHWKFWVIAFLIGCAGAPITTYKQPELSKRYRSLIIYGLMSNWQEQSYLEDHLESQLASRKVKTALAHDLLLPGITHQSGEWEAALRSVSADAVLMVGIEGFGRMREGGPFDQSLGDYRNDSGQRYTWTMTARLWDAFTGNDVWIGRIESSTSAHSGDLSLLWEGAMRVAEELIKQEILDRDVE